jgi:uncharacterized protein (DUF952 family)
MMIYHITTRKAWRAALATGDYRTEGLATDGFIHCSTLPQILPVAEYLFKDKRRLVILLIKPARLSSTLKWEPPSGGTPPPGVPAGDTFPHIYGPIDLDAVKRVLDLERNPDGVFELPEDLQRPDD